MNTLPDGCHSFMQLGYKFYGSNWVGGGMSDSVAGSMTSGPLPIAKSGLLETVKWRQAGYAPACQVWGNHPASLPLCGVIGFA